jgi:hypothetical protein
VERGKGIPREREVDKRRELWSTRGECVRKRARVYMCTENPGISVESLSLALDLSLSLSLSSLSDIRIIQGLFLKVSAEYLCSCNFKSLEILFVRARYA